MRAKRVHVICMCCPKNFEFAFGIKSAIKMIHPHPLGNPLVSAGVSHLEGFLLSLGPYYLLIHFLLFVLLLLISFTSIFAPIVAPIFNLVICHLVLHTAIDAVFDTMLLGTIGGYVVSRFPTTGALGFPQECTKDSRLFLKIEPTLVNRQAVSVHISPWWWHLPVCPFVPFLASLFLEELLELFHGNLKLAPWSRQNFDIGRPNAAEFGVGRVGVWLGDGLEELDSVNISFLKKKKKRFP